jgi:hypothetical protein
MYTTNQIYLYIPKFPLIVDIPFIVDIPRKTTSQIVIGSKPTWLSQTGGHFLTALILQ